MPGLVTHPRLWLRISLMVTHCSSIVGCVGGCGFFAAPKLAGRNMYQRETSGV
jgi:hypothetical protein